MLVHVQGESRHVLQSLYEVLRFSESDNGSIDSNIGFSPRAYEVDRIKPRAVIEEGGNHDIVDGECKGRKAF